MNAVRVLNTDYQTPEESPGFLLWQLTNRWQAAQRAALKEFELTHVQFVLLASLVWMDNDQPITQRALADRAATDAMMTSQVIRVLESRGLVQRTDHPGDRRARALSATAEGRALAMRATGAVEACDAAFFAPLADLPGFTNGLRTLLTG